MTPCPGVLVAVIAPPVPLDDLAADRQPHPYPLVFVSPVQALEGLEDAIQALGDFLSPKAVC